MKRVLSLLSLMLFFHLLVHSQLNPSVKSTYEVRKEIPAKVFTQMVQSLKPVAFSGSFEKQKKSLLSNVSPNMDGELMTKKVAELAAAIKPDMMRKGYSFVPGTSVKTMSYSLGLLKDLQNALKPEALADGWKFQKNAWLEEISKVK